MSNKAAVQSLWIGDRLPVLQQLSFRSFLYHGHPVQLYAYSEPANLPPGVELLDGNLILPESDIFTYQSGGRGVGSVSAFSNFFRYKLLYEKGGWWVDSDVVCLKPFCFEQASVFCSEGTRTGEITAGSCIIKAPQQSEFIKYCWNICCEKNKSELTWGEVGPKLVQEMIDRFDLSDSLMPCETFCPYSYFEIRLMLDADAGWSRITEKTHAVHLFSRMWEDENLDFSQQHPAGCLIESLKAQYL